MSTSFEIYSKVTDYVERRSSLEDLETWLVSRLPVFLENADSTGGRLAVLVELCLAEFHDGLRANRGVRSVLAQYTKDLRLSWFEYPETTSSDLTGTSTGVIAPGLIWPDPQLSWSRSPEGAAA